MYYADTLEKSGLVTTTPFAVEEPNLEKKLTSEVEITEDEVDKPHFALYLSSQLEPNAKLHDNSIIVCDTAYKYDTSSSCTSSSVKSTNPKSLVNLGTLTWYPATIEIIKHETSGITVFMVPESLLITPEVTSMTRQYFSRYIDSITYEKEFSLVNPSNENSNIQISTGILPKELFSYASLVLLFLGLFYSLISTISRRPKKLINPSYYIDIISHIIVFFRKTRPLLILGLIYGLTIYIFLLMSISIKDIGSINVGYIIDLIDSTFDINEIIFNTRKLQPVRLLLIISTFFLVVLPILLLSIDNFTFIVVNGMQKIHNKSLKPNISKYLLASFILIGAAVVSYTEPKIFIIFTSFILLCLVIIGFYVSKENIILVSLYTKSEKAIIITITIVIIISGYSYKGLYGNHVTYTYENLTSPESKLLVSPYMVKLPHNTLLNKLLLDTTKIDYSIFVDKYLVYTPIHKYAAHKDLSKYEANQNYYLITLGSYEKIQQAINILPAKESLFINQISYYIYTDSEKFMLDSYYFAKVTFKCDYLNLNPGSLKLRYKEIERLDNKRSIISSESKYNLINFPGCKIGESSTYQIPLDTTDWKENSLLKIEGYDIENIIDLRLSKVSKDQYGQVTNHSPVPIQFVSSADTIKNIDNKDDTVSVYYSDYEEELIIETKVDSDKMFDLAEPINMLIKKGLVNKDFLIWTPDGNRILLNRY